MNFENTLKERINLARLDRKQKNCIGTAFYLAGINEEDSGIEPEGFNMSGFVRIAEPQIGSLAVWCHHPCFIFKEEVYHMGVVRSLNPTRIVHRPRAEKQLLENQYCGRITEGYQYPSAKFYVPK